MYSFVWSNQLGGVESWERWILAQSVRITATRHTSPRRFCRFNRTIRSFVKRYKILHNSECLKKAGVKTFNRMQQKVLFQWWGMHFNVKLRFYIVSFQMQPISESVYSERRLYSMQPKDIDVTNINLIYFTQVYILKLK
jgi:hypothetical protein